VGVGRLFRGDRVKGLAALPQILGHSSIVTAQRCARISGDLMWREVEGDEFAVANGGQYAAVVVAVGGSGACQEPP